jgi:hypothetical protein
MTEELTTNREKVVPEESVESMDDNSTLMGRWSKRDRKHP